MPQKLLHAVLHKYRYKDVLDLLEDVDDKIRMRAKKMQNISKTGAAGEDRIVANLQQRMDNLVSLLIQRSGGYGAAPEVVFDLFDAILSHNRYLGNEMRRRRIVQRLYRKYWQRKD